MKIILFAKNHPNARAARAASFVRYCLVAILGLIIDIGLLALLVELSGINPETSPLLYVFVSISFIAAVINNYFFNVRWVFNVPGGKHLARFSRFFFVSVIGLILSNIFMFLFVSLAGIWYLLAKVITTAIVILWNYSVNAMWVFKK